MNPLQKVNHVSGILLTLGALLLFFVGGQVLLWGLDRRVPFEMVGYTVNPALAGDTVIVRAQVRRDLARRCSVTYSRVFFDSAGSRFDLTTGAQMMNADALDDLNRRTPDSLVISVTVPPKAAPGKGALVTALDYVCNPVHQMYPVPMLLTMDVEVL